MSKTMITPTRRFLRPLSAFLTILCLTLFPLVPVSASYFQTSALFGNYTASIFDDLVFSNPASITIADAPPPPATGPGIATPYPSNITVTGLTGTLSNITVTFNNLSMPRTRNYDFLLVAPGGQNLVLMSDVGHITASNNLNLTFSDAAATQLPIPPNHTVPLTSGTYRPTAVSFTAGDDTFPAPAPASTNKPAPEGTSTLASVFNGINPNGVWNLYIIDDELGGGPGTMAGGWSMDITTAGATAPTTTTVGSSLNPSLTNQAVTFTATVTSAGNPVTVGTVNFTDGPTVLCSTVSLNGAGQAVCTAPANTLNERNHIITATYSGTPSFGISNGSVTQTVNFPTAQTGASFCNNGGFNLPDGTVATPYPSLITVSTLIGTITKVTANVNGMNMPRPRDVDVLLVGPTSQTLLLMADTGDITPNNGINLTLDDAAAAPLPTGPGSNLSSGTFRPTDFLFTAGDDAFPPPAPAVFNRPAPTGTSTLAVFNTTNPNGGWRLFVQDDGLGGGAHAIANWCVNFSLAPLASTTSLVSSQTPIIVGNPVTFTASVSITGQTPTGNVEFFDGPTSLGVRPLVPAAQGLSPSAISTAALTTSTLGIGNHNITAQYIGVTTVGGGGFAPSLSNTVVQRIVNPTAASVSVSGQVSDESGNGIPRVVVKMIDTNGVERHAITNPFGYYRFEGVQAGQTYVFTVSAKNYQPVSFTQTITDEVSDLNIVLQR